MVVPVATAQQLSRSFRATLVAAMLLGIGASVGGLLVAAYASFSANVAPGPTIVLLLPCRLRVGLAAGRLGEVAAAAAGSVRAP